MDNTNEAGTTAAGGADSASSGACEDATPLPTWTPPAPRTWGQLAEGRWLDGRTIRCHIPGGWIPPECADRPDEVDESPEAS